MKEKWNERFGAEGYFYGTEPNDFLVEQAMKIKVGGKVLCLAEGEGRNAIFLAGLGFDVTAVDFSSEGLKKLKQLAKKKNVNVATALADLGQFDMGVDKWDAIISIWCHLEEPLRAIVTANAKRALKKGGLFILESYTPDQLKYKTGGPSDPSMLLTEAKLAKEFAGFKFLMNKEKVREISEGLGHKGTSAVVQFVAQKP